MNILHNLDIVIIITYMLSCLFIGLYKAKQIKTLKQFAVGFKDAKSQLLTCVIFATFIGAGSTIGDVEKLYLLGAALILKQLVTPLYWLLCAQIFGKNIERFKGCMTISEVMHKLYGKTGRWVTNILSIAAGIGALAAQATAMGYIFHYFLNIGVFQGMLISYAILTIYSTLGGIRAVVITEIFQFIVFFFIIPAAFILLFFMNMDAVLANLSSLPLTHTSLINSDYSSLMIWGLILYTLLPDCSSATMQRYLMASDSRELVKSLKSIALISIPFAVFLCLIAYFLKITAPNINPAEALLYFTTQLPIGFKGVMVAGLLAIVMSTAESYINSTAVILVNDIIKPVAPKLNNSMQLLLVRFCTVATSTVALYIVSMEKGALELIWFVKNIWLPIMVVPLISGFLGIKTTGRAFFVSAIFALAAIAFGFQISGGFDPISLIIGVLGSAFGFFATYFFQAYKANILRPIRIKSLVIKIQKEKLIIVEYLHKALRQFKERIKEEKIRYTAFAGFVLYCYFVHMLTFSSVPAANTVLAMLMIAGYALCGLILMRDVLFSKQFLKKYIMPYFYLTITFCLPLVGSFMVFASSGNDFWIINGLLLSSSIFFFCNAVSSLMSITVGTILGYAIANATHAFAGLSINIIHHFTGSYTYLFFLVGVLLFLRPRERNHEERIDTMQVISSAIAHEVRTPITAITGHTETLAGVLEQLVSSAKKTGDTYNLKLSQNDYEYFKYLSDNMKSFSKKALDVVDNMLLMMRKSLKEEAMCTRPVSRIINASLEEFALYSKKLKKVQVDIAEDFKLFCAPKALQHVFLNLLKNAEKHGGSDVEIKIRAKGNKVYFKDSGKGIHPDILPYIFDRFYTKSKDGTGLGLSYCQMAMEAFDGDISCESKVGEYTQFTLSFPKVKERKFSPKLVDKMKPVRMNPSLT